MTDSLPIRAARTLTDFGFDGHAALESLIAASPYGSVLQAVASLSVFSHPETVRQTGNRPVIRVVRNAARRGEIIEIDGQRVGLDDNKAPTDVFMWCNGWKRRPRDIQFNHVYTDSQDPESYACLANLCVTPSFLAKLTDTNPLVRDMLRYRVWDMYGWYPRRAEEPREPNGYRDLNWAPFLPPVDDVWSLLEHTMARRKADRTTRMAVELGTLPTS